MERASGLVLGEFTVCIFGLLEGEIGGGGKEGVKGVVEGVDAADMGLGQLDGGELTVVDELRGLFDGEVVKVCWRHGRWTP